MVCGTQYKLSHSNLLEKYGLRPRLEHHRGHQEGHKLDYLTSINDVCECVCTSGLLLWRFAEELCLKRLRSIADLSLQPYSQLRGLKA